MEQDKKLLLVDDDPMVSWSLGRFMTREGWNVNICNDGIEAMQLLEMQKYDALVTDVQMPRLNGIALVEWTKRNRPEMPIIVITAFGSSSVRSVCLQKGAFHYLEKPVDPGLITQLLSVESERDTFSGTVTCIDLFDYLQMMLVSRKQALVEVQSVDGETGLLFISGGDVIHAECSGMVGERAFIHCVSFLGGNFSSLPWREPNKRSIDKKGDFLLMDAARKKDETGNIDLQTNRPSEHPEEAELAFNIRNSILPGPGDKDPSQEK